MLTTFCRTFMTLYGRQEDPGISALIYFQSAVRFFYHVTLVRSLYFRQHEKRFCMHRISAYE
jgi:hypothetical protein